MLEFRAKGTSVNLSFLPGDLHLIQNEDGLFILTIAGIDKVRALCDPQVSCSANRTRTHVSSERADRRNEGNPFAERSEGVDFPPRTTRPTTDISNSHSHSNRGRDRPKGLLRDCVKQRPQ